MNPFDLKRDVEMTDQAVVADLNQRSKKSKCSIELAPVGTISSNGDISIRAKIAKAMQKVGNEDMIMVEEAKSRVTDLDVVVGMQLDRGCPSPRFITNADNISCELENPYILLHEVELSNLQAKFAKLTVPLWLLGDRETSIFNCHLFVACKFLFDPIAQVDCATRFTEIFQNVVVRQFIDFHIAITLAHMHFNFVRRLILVNKAER